MEDFPMDTPLGITQATSTAPGKLLPRKSRNQYERAYNLFMEWRKNKQAFSFSEKVLLAYFQELAAKMKPTSLWSIYSMLRKTINLKHNINVRKYPKLSAFLKRTSDGYKPKKSKTLTPQQIKDFLSTAPDEDFLFAKVGLIFGILGACRREELWNIETSHVEDINTALLVHIPDTKTKTERLFVIGDSFYKTCKKYMELRPPDVGNNSRFFLNYQRGRCTKQPIGINKFGNIPSQIASFLNLPNPTSYTGHCMRRYAASILVDSGADITTLKPNQTSFAEYYRNTSIINKTETVAEISNVVQGSGANASMNVDIKEEIIEVNSKNEKATKINIMYEDTSIKNKTKTVEEIGGAVQGSTANASMNVDIKEEIIEVNSKNEKATNINIMYGDTNNKKETVQEISDAVQGSSANAFMNADMKKEMREVNSKNEKATNINITYGPSSANSENTQFVERRLISFSNCQNVSNITVNIYLPEKNCS